VIPPCSEKSKSEKIGTVIGAGGGGGFRRVRGEAEEELGFR